MRIRGARKRLDLETWPVLRLPEHALCIVSLLELSLSCWVPTYVNFAASRSSVVKGRVHCAARRSLSNDASVYWRASVTVTVKGLLLLRTQSSSRRLRSYSHRLKSTSSQ
ncbi:Protein of unknown function [Gryllus bimaculatus]|nr:Protein of unknown function [Gryllus bimaculatus]